MGKKKASKPATNGRPLPNHRHAVKPDRAGRDKSPSTVLTVRVDESLLVDVLRVAGENGMETDDLVRQVLSDACRAPSISALRAAAVLNGLAACADGDPAADPLLLRLAELVLAARAVVRYAAQLRPAVLDVLGQQGRAVLDELAQSVDEVERQAVWLAGGAVADIDAAGDDDNEPSPGK